jgi:hypothetical protein
MMEKTVMKLDVNDLKSTLISVVEGINELECKMLDAVNLFERVRLDYFVKLVQNTEGWEIVRYNPRCGHVVIGKTFPPSVKCLGDFTDKYKKVRIKFRIYNETNDFRINLEGGVDDIYRICHRELGIRIDPSRYDKCEWDIRVLGKMIKK